MDLLSLAIGLGLAVGLLFSEFFALAAGGMIVPGYFALYLDQPLGIIITLALSLLTYGIIRALGMVAVLYGRRLTALTILVGFLLGCGARWVHNGWYPATPIKADVIGYIIPGLVAVWFARQGILETITSLLTAAAVVRLLLILIAGEELLG